MRFVIGMSYLPKYLSIKMRLGNTCCLSFHILDFLCRVTIRNLRKSGEGRGEIVPLIRYAMRLLLSEKLS